MRAISGGVGGQTITGDAPQGKTWLARFPVLPASSPLAWAIAAALTVTALLVRIAAAPVLPPGYPFLTFFPAVIVTSVLFGARLGGVQAAACGLIAWYFFIPPVRSLALSSGSGVAMAFYGFVVVTDVVLIHWMQGAIHQLAREREVSRALAETRELLFRELQHRVSNNLQVAAALLSMQRTRVADTEARAALEETARRLALIGRISRQLYDASGEALPLLPFLRQLGTDVMEAAGRDDVALSVEGDGDVRLEPDAAIPTALVVAEAIANALEHGLPSGRPGSIAVDVGYDPSARELCVTVTDDGRGLPPGFDAQIATSLGLQIARMLAASCGGQFTVAHTDATRATLRLPC